MDRPVLTCHEALEELVASIKDDNRDRFYDAFSSAQEVLALHAQQPVRIIPNSPMEFLPDDLLGELDDEGIAAINGDWVYEFPDDDDYE